MDRLTTEDLLDLEFVDAAEWVIESGDLTYQIVEARATSLMPLFCVPNALYAFCRNEEVLYIGKTTRSLERRLGGYSRPGKSQRTNLRCNQKIRAAIERGELVRILVLTPVGRLQYGDFEINLAAGLEDSLIRRFDPPWNGRSKGTTLSESAEIEEEESAGSESILATLPTSDFDACPRFAVNLAPTYYIRGIVNPGVEASHHLGGDGEPITIKFSNGAPPVVSKINRTANRSGAARIVGNNHVIADWFQKNFCAGSSVIARILGPNEIEFLA